MRQARSRGLLPDLLGELADRIQRPTGRARAHPARTTAFVAPHPTDGAPPQPSPHAAHHGPSRARRILGTSVGTPRCSRMRTIPARSVSAAIIFNRPPHPTHRSASTPHTRHNRLCPVDAIAASLGRHRRCGFRGSLRLGKSRLFLRVLGRSRAGTLRSHGRQRNHRGPPRRMWREHPMRSAPKASSAEARERSASP